MLYLNAFIYLLFFEFHRTDFFLYKLPTGRFQNTGFLLLEEFFNDCGPIYTCIHIYFLK